jgi:hypothetical protein
MLISAQPKSIGFYLETIVVSKSETSDYSEEPARKAIGALVHNIDLESLMLTH